MLLKLLQVNLFVCYRVAVCWSGCNTLISRVFAARIKTLYTLAYSARSRMSPESTHNTEFMGFYMEVLTLGVIL